MSSFVYYKFKSARNEQKIAFDGTGISVFDLKKEIILSNSFGKATDVDLLLFDSSSDKEYTDDSQIIPRSTLVIAKRMPARPGKGKAAIYIAGAGPAASSSGKQDSSRNGIAASATGAGNSGGGPSTWNKSMGGAMSKRFDGREDRSRPAFNSRTSVDVGSSASASAPVSTSKADEKKPATDSSAAADDEAEMIKAMFEASDEVWKETQERMSHATPIYNGRGGARRPPGQHQAYQRPVETKPLPPSYICHRCSKPGHWIQDCPTNSDRDFDNRPRIKRTTGIPRSFLKSVEAPDGAQGVMVTPEGTFVVAQPDVASWEKQRSRPTPLTAAEVRERAPSDASLGCPICKKLLRDAVKTPCCSRTFDEECIHTHLLEEDFVCPNCHKQVESLDKVVPDLAARDRVRRYIQDEIARSLAGPENENGTPAAADSTSKATTPTPASGDPEISFEQQPGNNTPEPSNAPTNTIPPGPSPFEAQINIVRQQIEHVMAMINNPTLTPHVRTQFQMQLPELATQLSALMAQAAMFGAGGGGEFMGMGMPMGQGMNMGMGMGQMGMGGMGMSNGGYGDQGVYGGQQQQQQNYSGGRAFTQNNRAHNDVESPYQRVAPPNRRRNALKRDRPEDFVDVNGAGGQKYARY